mmetsp:Transcript_21248/g.49435  ORF Transcript_21248/g.49435 Transcript_21248/m.49435 type:complete len:201 (+) Transcript_21248:21-623(+)
MADAVYPPVPSPSRWRSLSTSLMLRPSLLRCRAIHPRRILRSWLGDAISQTTALFLCAFATPSARKGSGPAGRRHAISTRSTRAWRPAATFSWTMSSEVVGDVVQCWRSRVNPTPAIYKCNCKSSYQNCQEHVGSCTKVTDPTKLWDFAAKDLEGSMTFFAAMLTVAVLLMLPCAVYVPYTFLRKRCRRTGPDAAAVAPE